MGLGGRESTYVRLLAAAIVALLPACGSNGSGTGGDGQPSGSNQGALTCSDLFDQDTVRTYAIEIAPDEWQRIQAEFNDVATLTAQGNDFVARHPVVFRTGSETVSDATFKLHGQSSWAQAVT